MRMRAQSWRQPATFCASSSGSHCWECRSSRRDYDPRVPRPCLALFARQGGDFETLSNTADRKRESMGKAIMSKTIWLGAVAYNPKVVTIWEGMRSYFHEEAHLPVEIVLFQSYEAQVMALLAQPGDVVPRIDIAWNTNLAYLQADEWSGHACRAIAMRDTDLGWMTKIVAV